MSRGRIQALIKKDLSLYFRNRFISVITVLGIIVYIVFYFVMPDTVDENLDIGMYTTFEIPGFTQVEEEGLRVIKAESDEALQESVINGDYVAGISMSGDMDAIVSTGEIPAVTLYLASDVPEYIKDSITAILRELAFQAAGQPFNVEIDQEIIGDDMSGMQIPPRDRMRPMLAIFIIMFETFGLANLIAEELETGTARALLVSPLSVNELFIGKGLFGIGLAFVQSVIFMVVVGGFSQQPLIILTALLLGAMMATSIGFLIGSVARDFMSVLAWGVIIFVILLVPAFGVMFPGAVSGWIEYVPSYYLVDMVHRAANFNAGWDSIWSNVLILAAFSAAVFVLGIYGIRRKVR
ncbi:MAG: ABC transporter permease [Dehalococcoidales bacterium]|nr:ABC transporter permease [Dehalococcoidales bacterium]